MYAELSLPLCLVFFIWFLQMNWACFYSFIFQPVFSTSSNKHCWGCDFLHPRTSWTSFSESSFSAWLLHLSFHPPLFLTSVDLWFSFPEHRARHCGKKGKSGGGGGGESREGLDGRAEKKMGEAGALRKHSSSYFPSLLFSQEDEGVGLVRGRGSESTHVTPLILTLRWDEILHLLRFFTYHKSILFVWKEPQNKKKITNTQTE